MASKLHPWERHMIGRKSWSRYKEQPDNLQGNVEKSFQTVEGIGLSGHLPLMVLVNGLSSPTSLLHHCPRQASLSPCLNLCLSFSCWIHLHPHLLPMQSSTFPANSGRPEMLISVAGSWPIRVTCQDREAKAGDICWYFQLGWKQTNWTGVKCQRLLSVLPGREGGPSPRGDRLLCVPEGVCVGHAAVLEVYQEGWVGCVCQSPPSSHHGLSG